MSCVRLFAHEKSPCALIDDRVKPADEKERLLLDAQLNTELSETFKKIDDEYKKIIEATSLGRDNRFCRDSIDVEELVIVTRRYYDLAGGFKAKILCHLNNSLLDSKRQDLHIAINNADGDKEVALDDVLIIYQKMEELDKAIEYAIDQRKRWLAVEAYNKWKYPPVQTNICTLL